MELVSKEELTKNLECVYKNDQKMINWCLKDIDFAIKLRNKIVTFYKPHIEKIFVLVLMNILKAISRKHINKLKLLEIILNILKEKIYIKLIMKLPN